jgi:hypothetical protein
MKTSYRSISSDMSNNPLANELNYRLHVIHTFPSLKILDKHEVTFAERQAAASLYGEDRARTVAFMKRRPLWRNPPPQPFGGISIVSRDMYREIDGFRRRERARSAAETTEAAQRDAAVGEPVVPLASAVEALAATSRTLKDILAPADSPPPPPASTLLAGRKRDFFAMKRFVTGQVLTAAAAAAAVLLPLPRIEKMHSSFQLMLVASSVHRGLRSKPRRDCRRRRTPAGPRRSRTATAPGRAGRCPAGWRL